MRHERYGKYHYCIRCDYFTRKSTTLSMHYALKHSEYSPHKCQSCPRVFKTKSQLNHHILSNHTDSLIQCRQPGCNETFKNQVNYRIHWIRKHEDIHNFMVKSKSTGDWKCLTCSKVQSKNALTYHVTLCSPCSPFSQEGKSLQALVDEPDIDPVLEPENPVFFPTIGTSDTYSALREENRLDRENNEIPINAMDVMLMDYDYEPMYFDVLKVNY